MMLCPFWKFWLSLNLMAVSAQQFIESPSTLIYICSGIATIQSHPNTICLVPYITGPELFVPALNSCLQKVEEHMHTVLERYKYTLWALNRMKLKIRTPASKNNNKRGTNTSGSTTSNNQRPHIVVPYTKGLSEGLKNACSKEGVQVYFRGDRTTRSLLVAPQDKHPITKKSGVIYRYKCDRVECDEEYIRDSSRSFGERFKEHLKTPSPIYDHFNTSGHTKTIDNFSIVGREDLNLIRTIREALYIRVNNPSLKYIGK